MTKKQPAAIKPTGRKCVNCKEKEAIGDEFCSARCARIFHGCPTGGDIVEPKPTPPRTKAKATR